MRTGADPAGVFDALLRRGQIVVHPSDVERTQALADMAATTDERVLAQSREQVAELNAAIREHRRRQDPESSGTRVDAVTTEAGEEIGLGDTVATRRNDPTLGVANRQTWTVTGLGEDGSLVLHRPGRDRQIPASYAHRYVELAYASTVHGMQGETVDAAHVLIGETTGAATAYVAMTRGRHTNIAHLVAQDLAEAKKQWIDVFGRDRGDLGPSHARGLAIDAIDRYGPDAPRRRRHQPALSEPPRPVPQRSGRSFGL
jgi:ATP-dependent exoDNAse (exonuclease V) alpha subunit